jgi:hypothetical protein
MLDRQVQLIDVLHYNAYLLVPRLVYHLSTKLKNNAIHNCIVQAEEVKLIRFLTRYGYATRAAPFCKLHGAYGYTNMKNVNYINNCDNWNRIIHHSSDSVLGNAFQCMLHVSTQGGYKFVYHSIE